MDFTGTHTFAAPIEQVWAMIRDQEAHVSKFAGMGHTDIEVIEYDTSEDHVRLVVSRTITVELPGFAKKVLKPTNTVLSTDEWRRNADGTCTGSFSVDTPGAPIHSTGRTLLRADGDDRTFYEIAVHLDVKVPIIGGKIASWAKGDVVKQIDMEFAAGESWLATRS